MTERLYLYPDTSSLKKHVFEMLFEMLNPLVIVVITTNAPVV